MEGSHACCGLWFLSGTFAIFWPHGAFTLALSPLGFPGIARDSCLNDSCHPTVYVSAYLVSLMAALPHCLSHGLSRLPEHTPGSLYDCPSSLVSLLDFRIPV